MTNKILRTPFHLPSIRKSTAVALLTVLLSACGGGNWGFPYRIDIQQGNWVTSSQIEQLQVGMTREQVRFILGTPTLQDIFYSDRWEYPYYFKPGYGDDELRTFTVWFDGDQLTRWDGSKQPDRQPFERADSGADDKKEAKSTNEQLNETAEPASSEGISKESQTTPIEGPSSSPVLIENAPDPREINQPPTPSDGSPEQPTPPLPDTQEGQPSEVPAPMPEPVPEPMPGSMPETGTEPMPPASGQQHSIMP